jgi:predicted amidohydrolase
MDVVLVQLDTDWEAPGANRERVRRLVAAAPPARGSLVVLPEMFATGFSMAEQSAAEPESGRTATFMAELAREHGIYVCGGLAIADERGAARNTALLFGPDGGEQARYVKRHAFTPAGEAEHYRPGAAPLPVVEIGGFRLAPAICYDLRFPEDFRDAVRRGADLLVVIANWPAVRAEHWAVLLRARAVENQAVVLGVNRCGTDPNHDYAGGSLAVGPDGAVLAEAGTGEALLSVSLDAGVVAQCRESFPVLADLRPQTE